MPFLPPAWQFDVKGETADVGSHSVQEPEHELIDSLALILTESEVYDDLDERCTAAQRVDKLSPHPGIDS